MINERTDLPGLLSDATRDPCLTYWVPLYLGYDYYFYADDPESAVQYYKIAAAHSDAPVGVRTIAATLLSDSGDPTAAAKMLLGLAMASENEAPACAQIASTLDRLYDEDMADGFLDYSFIGPARGAKDFVDAYERTRTIAAGLCREYLLRFERMVQLAHAQEADTAYASDHAGEHAPDAATLFREGYLPYETRDFQRLSDGSEVVYVRDAPTSRWVARMRSPDGRIADPRHAARY